MGALFFFLLLVSLVIVVGGANYPWRTSLSVCWRNSSCKRALIVSHGGEPNFITRPYDSLAAFSEAWEVGTDCIKGDLRVSKDNVSMVVHSSPFLWYESEDCLGERVENMMASQVEKCHIFPSFTQTFLSVPFLLKWAAGKVNVMLCVKERSDIPRAITTLVEENATDRAFLEIKVPDLETHVLKERPPYWDQVYYLAEMNSVEEMKLLLSDKFKPLIKQLFSFEFGTSWREWGVNVSEVVRQQLHPRNVRSLAATDRFLPGEESQVELFREGFDVVYTYGTYDGVLARTKIDKERGIYPP